MEGAGQLRANPRVLLARCLYQHFYHLTLSDDADLKSIYDKTRFDYSAGAGGMLDRFGYGFALGRVFDEVEHDHGQYDAPRVLFWAGCMIARRALYLEAGGLDESYFAHFEEIDLCWRMQLLGYRIESEPKTVVYHYNAYTIRAASGWKMYLNHRNSVVTLIKNLPAGRLLAVLPLRGVLDGVTMLTSAFRKEPARAWAVVRAHGWIWGHLPRILAARGRTRRLRRVPDAGVLARLYPGSVVWDYFARGRRTAADILGKRQ